MVSRVGFFICVLILGIGCVSASAGRYVIAVSNAQGSDNMYCRVGLVAEDGGIDWGNESKLDEPGKSPSLATDGDVAVLVFADKDKVLFYRVGEVSRRSLTVEWGPVLEFSKGRHPIVSMSKKTAVALFLGTKKDRLFCMTGEVRGERKQVVWSEPVLFDEKGKNPAIAMGSP